MNQIIPPFSIAYTGKDADEHTVDALLLGDSVIGAAKLYSAVIHYTMFGYVPRGNYKKEYRCYAQASRENCYEFWFFVATAAYQGSVDAGLHKDAVKFVFARILDALKSAWIRPKRMDETVETLVELLKQDSAHRRDVEIVLANGLNQANDNLASLASKLVDTLPALAEVTRSPARQLVAPVGPSCRELTQLNNTQLSTVISEPEAEVIRGKGDMEVEEMVRLRCNRISEINLESGHCILEIEGYERPVKGMIADPALKTPKNIYTRALDEQSGFYVSAKPIKKNGELYQLHIADAS